MHELSIAHHMVRVAEEAAREAGATRVTAVYLRLGELAGVVREALDFAYEFAVEGTLLEGSKLVVEPVEVRAFCSSCEREVLLPDSRRLRCPDCDVPTPDLRSGRDLEIRAIDYDAEPPSASSTSTSEAKRPHSNPSPAVTVPRRAADAS